MKKLALFLFFFLSLAANADKYSMSPMYIEGLIKPGTAKDFKIRIINSSNAPLKDYQLVIEEFIYDDKREKVLHDSKAVNPKSLVKFVKASASKINVEPKKFIEVTLNVAVPKDFVGSGYFRYTIKEAPSKKGGSAIGKLQYYSGLAFIKASGTEKINFSIVNPKIEKNKVYFSFKNTGNAYLKFKSNAFLLKEDQKQAKFPVSNKKNQNEFYVFEGQTRELFFYIDDKMLKPKTKNKVLINFFNEKTGWSASAKLDVEK